jgi:hypothetical protein
VCYDSPAELTSHENGWRSSVPPILDRLIVNGLINRVGGRGGCQEASVVKSRETASSADLGGSSKYSNENFED